MRIDAMKRFFTPLLMIVILLLLLISNLSAQINLSENKWLSDQISQMEKMKKESSILITTYQTEIQKCENTIKKSQDIISLAQQKNNRQAESVATDALMKSYDAKKKNMELLDFEKFNFTLLEKKLSEFRLLLLELEVVETGGKDECDKLVVQLERDKRALKNFMKTIRMTDNERNDWTEEGTDGMKEAGMSLLKFFTGELTNHITARDGKLKLIKKEIDKYKKEKVSEVIKNKYLLDRMDQKLKKAEDLYKKLLFKKTADIVLKADNMTEILKSEAELSESIMSSGDKEVVDVLSDKEIRSQLWDINSSFADLLLDYESEIRASTKFFEKYTPLTSRLTIVRYLSYAGTKLYLSAERIDQLSEVAQQELNAVNALKKQIESTTQKLNDCYGQSKPSK